MTEYEKWRNEIVHRYTVSAEDDIVDMSDDELDDIAGNVLPSGDVSDLYCAAREEGLDLDTQTLLKFALEHWWLATSEPKEDSYESAAEAIAGCIADDIGERFLSDVSDIAIAEIDARDLAKLDDLDDEEGV